MIRKGEAVVFEDSFEVFEEGIVVGFQELFEEDIVVVFKECFEDVFEEDIIVVFEELLEEIFEDIFEKDVAVVFEDVFDEGFTVVLEFNPGGDLVIDFDVVEEPVFAVDFMGVLAECTLVDVALVIEVVLVVGCGTKS
ncbi:hypothetical protein ACEPPN_015131 [Leptodophora sp. 'Broadleaf-Isolate-01']